MTHSPNKQAILILTNRISKDVINRYHKLKRDIGNTSDLFLLYHTNNKNVPIGLKGIQIETFSNDILKTLGYKPIRETLVPGSNHFPVLKFFLEHPAYSHYWCIEDDVAFNGNWSDFFKNVSSNTDYDFITSHIRRYSDKPYWFWWRTMNFPGGMNKEDMLNSFNPIYRISNKALQYIDTCLKNGYSGHHEALLPSLLKSGGFKIADLSSVDNHVTPYLSYCTLSTMRWKPVIFVLPNRNQLYHPVKAKVSFKQVLVYIKRTIYNQTEYYT